MGLYTVILLAGLLTVPREVEEAARLDGASETRIFFQIRMPHLRPVWLTTLVMATTYGLRGFDVPYLLTNGGPGVSTELLTTYMYKTAFTSTDYGYSSAISVFIVAECVVAWTPCRLKRSSHAARTTGASTSMCSGRQPAITALAATFSTVAAP